MRRLGRWTLNALTVVSLVMCVATASLWVRSYRVGDVIEATVADAGHRRVDTRYARSAGGLVLLERGFIGPLNSSGDVTRFPGVHDGIRHRKSTPSASTFLMARGSFWHRHGFVAGSY